MHASKRCMSLALWIIIVGISDSAKVLLLPVNFRSHVLYFGQTASALAESGHDAVLAVPANNHAPAGLHRNVTVLTYKVPGDVPYASSEEVSELETKLVVTDSWLEWMSLIDKLTVDMFDAWNKDCDALHDEYSAIKAQNFDIAIVDVMGYTCYYSMPYKLGIPWISLSVPWLSWLYRIPNFSSQWPSVMTAHSDRMDFWQRLTTFGLDLMDYMLIDYTNIYTLKHVPEKPPLDGATLLANSAMWWHLYDISVGFPRANMPNTIDVGDIMARSPQPLPKDYQEILATSKTKVIIVSLGSHFDQVPEEWVQKFCAAFNQLSYTIIWKSRGMPNCNLKKNIHIKKWLPQNDLLADSRVGLFITHCGLNSVIESVNHGKPMVGVPVTNDQPYNGVIIREKGYGVNLNLKTFTPDELANAVNEVITNPKYSENVRRGMQIMHTKPQPVGERMSFWVDHVMKYGGNHMRTNAHHLSLAEFLMVDIYMFLMAIVVAVTLIITTIAYCVCKCFWRICRKGNKLKTQ